MNGQETMRRVLYGISAALLFVAMPWDALADNGPDHRLTQTGAIELGTSGGNVNDSSRRFCCSGTLGALVQDSGEYFILSNNHVLARGNQGTPGEGVNHPGMVDQNCGTTGVIAELSDFVPIVFGSRKSPGGPNQVDAAIALVTGNVAADGAILDIGPLSASTLTAVPGLAVQKSGRTTGNTKGSVSAVNVTATVGYSSECGGRTTQYAEFENQIMISGSSFSAGGDSGSIIVEDVAPCGVLPRAVGLLFAGSSNSTIANPIGAVLAQLGVSLVAGSPQACPPMGTISGTVTDDSAVPVPISGATVTVVGAGLSATTDANGAYLMGGVEVGIHDVEASAQGFQTSAPQAVEVLENQTTSGVDFALTAAPDATEAIAQCIVYETQGGKNKDRNLLINVQVVDDFGTALSGASVSVSLTRDGASFGSASATTDEFGEARFVARNAPGGEYVTTVEDIVHGSLAYAGPQSTPANSFVKTSGQQSASFCQPGASPLGSAAPAGASAISRAADVKARHSARLLAIPGVVGHGVGISGGQPVIEVYLANENAEARAQIPAALDGVPVRVVVTGEFVAY